MINIPVNFNVEKTKHQIKKILSRVTHKQENFRNYVKFT